eukprot:GHVO01060721.1.p1 GENE.GHVO01060721.1~~GHVO01060721.1.p1  ORF type:complete len:131 (+),score=2.11 GHVO01060721.1:88-480(+)
MKEWILNMAALGRIIPTRDPNQIISRHFVTGNTQKKRVVGDFENVNRFFTPFQMRMKDRLLLALGRARTKLDEPRAYYSGTIREEDWWIWGLEFEGKTYQYTVLPMGISPAPGLFHGAIELLLKRDKCRT